MNYRNNNRLGGGVNSSDRIIKNSTDTDKIYFYKGKYVPQIGYSLWKNTPYIHDEGITLSKLNEDMIYEILYDDKSNPFHDYFQEEDLMVEIPENNEYLSIEYPTYLDLEDDLGITENDIENFLDWLSTKIKFMYNNDIVYFGGNVYHMWNRNKPKTDKEYNYYDYEALWDWDEEEIESSRKLIKSNNVMGKITDELEIQNIIKALLPYKVTIQAESTNNYAVTLKNCNVTLIENGIMFNNSESYFYFYFYNNPEASLPGAYDYQEEIVLINDDCVLTIFLNDETVEQVNPYSYFYH